MNITNGDSNIDAVAVVSGATVTVYHETFGTPSGTPAWAPAWPAPVI
jgi:hypothetical protein